MTVHDRIIIDDMALVLVGYVADIGSDDECIPALLRARFIPREILQYLDAARDIARAARAGEAELWDRLMRAEKRDHDT